MIVGVAYRQGKLAAGARAIREALEAGQTVCITHPERPPLMAHAMDGFTAVEWLTCADAPAPPPDYYLSPLCFIGGRA